MLLLLYSCFTILFYNSPMHMAMRNNRKTNIWNVHIKINKYALQHMTRYGRELHQYLHV